MSVPGCHSQMSNYGTDVESLPMRVRLAMPMWFNLAFANFVTLRSEAGRKLGPIHRLISSRRAHARHLAV